MSGYILWNYPFLQGIYNNDVALLFVTLISFFILLYYRLYVPLLFTSLLLLFFNMILILELPNFFFISSYWSNYALFIRVVSLPVGIWGLARSIREVKTMVLDNERVIDSFNFIVEGGGGREQWVLGATETAIIDSHMPGIITERKDVTHSFLGDKRKFLVVRHAKYREFRMFIGARSFGEHLDASWFLAVEPGFFKKIVSKHTTGNPTALSQRLDFFAQQDIKAMKAVAHHCFKRCLQQLQEELNLDTSGLNADTKGFLNVW